VFGINLVVLGLDYKCWMESLLQKHNLPGFILFLTLCASTFISGFLSRDLQCQEIGEE
jgi:hypothetical protein